MVLKIDFLRGRATGLTGTLRAAIRDFVQKRFERRSVIATNQVSKI